MSTSTRLVCVSFFFFFLSVGRGRVFNFAFNLRHAPNFHSTPFDRARFCIFIDLIDLLSTVARAPESKHEKEMEKSPTRKNE